MAKAKTETKNGGAPAWPASKVETRKLAELVPYARNARTHSAKQVDQIAASIREWGWTNPILVTPDGTIIAGHGRVLAAQKLGLGHVPAMVAEGWTEAQIRAYVIADNKLALNAGWDDTLISNEFRDLLDDGFDLPLMGFSDDEIAEHLEGFDVELPGLPEGERDPFQKMSFSVHDEQHEIISEAIAKARKSPRLDIGLNENKNGSALALLAEHYLNQDKGE